MYDQLFWIIFPLCVSVAYQELTELKQVPPRSFPYLADVQAHQWCHGILITKNYVLTNARFVVNCTTDIKIYLGWYSYPEYFHEESIKNETDSQIYTASNVIVHPDFKEILKYWMYSNDIALVKLSQTVNITRGVSPAKLADPKTFKNKDLTGQYGIVFGWWPAEYVSSAQVEIRPHAYCEDVFEQTYLRDRQFCIKWPEGQRLCSRQSHPMEINGTLIGIQQDDPRNDVKCIDYEYKFINILYYYDWIMKNSDLQEYINNSYNNFKSKFIESLKPTKKPTLVPHRRRKLKCEIELVYHCIAFLQFT